MLETPKLIRPLLLIHGLTDDNVFPANTLRLSSALLAAGRPHEVLLQSGATHYVRDETAFENLHWHQVRFLQQHLGVKPPGTPTIASAPVPGPVTQLPSG